MTTAEGVLGWRGRIGFVSPSVVQLPWDIEALLPDGVSLLTTGLSVRSYDDAEFEAALAGAEAAVGVVVAAGARAVVVAGVPLAVRRGRAAEQETLAAWSQRAGAPVTSGLSASVEGLARLGARRLLVATAYPEESNRALEAYLGDAGLEVLATARLHSSSPGEAQRLDPDAWRVLITALARDHPGADAVFLGASGNVQGITAAVETATGLALVDQFKATLWWGLGQLGITDRRGHGGRLLDAPL